MSVSSVSGSSSSTTSSSSSSYTLGTDAFLKILVTQLQNQNPLDPADPTEFVGELAQLSQVEQLTNISKGIESLKDGSASDWISSIGKKMNVSSSTLSEGDQVSISVDGEYDKVVMTLKDQSTGNEKQVTFSGDDELVWKNEDSTTYKITNIAATKDGTTKDVSLSVLRVITGVYMTDEGVQLAAGDGSVYSTSDIKLIMQ
jgi:flagellar basal-body rod modification protein FlgD